MTKPDLRLTLSRAVALVSEAHEILRLLRACPTCGDLFIRVRRQVYCTAWCAQQTRNRRKR